jgi:hypothetical protein
MQVMSARRAAHCLYRYGEVKTYASEALKVLLGGADEASAR